MAYEHDIFISYRRSRETCDWITNHFLPLLKVRVAFEIGREPDVFVDRQIESGTSWPVSLGVALGRSRILILLWTANYLSSVWCAAELSHMLGREREENLRTDDQRHGIIVPAFIHDGAKFPADLGHIQHFEIQNTFNLRMARDSARAEELDAKLADEAPAIAACINHAPSWRDTWSKDAAAEFFRKYHQAAEAIQSTVPRFTTP